MKIPREFEREMFMFISSELQTGDPVHNSVELAIRCREFALRWFSLVDHPSRFQTEAVMPLVSWAERLGKHVGDFYFKS